MHRLGRVQEERRRARAGQRGRDLLADHARLAHAGEDHAAAALAEEIDGAIEALVHAFDEREDGRGLGLEYFPGERAISHERVPWRRMPVYAPRPV